MAVGVLAAGLYALLSNWLMSRHPTAPWAVASLCGPLWLSAVGLVPRRLAPWGHAVLIGAGCLLALWVSGGAASEVNRLYLAQHLCINLLLGGFFAVSLLPGRTPLISRLAQRVHGGLSEGMKAYTRRLTIVWVAYFVVMTAVSALVFAGRPFSDWTLLCNIITPISVALLFGGEHALRYRLHPEFERATLAQAVGAFREAAGAGRAGVR